MIVEKSPLLEELDWLDHGFYGRDAAVTNQLVGIQTDTPYAKSPVLFIPQNFTDIVISANAPLPPEADASVTDTPGLGLAIRTADCVPLLLVCTKTRNIAAVHISWHNALSGIAAKTLERMVENGAKPNRMMAAIGPHLHERSFQIRNDVRDKFITHQPDTIGFFKPFRDRWLMDMSGIVEHQLRKAGVTKVSLSPTNTFTSPNHHSWRRRDDDPIHETQRNVSVILLRKSDN